MNYPAVCYDIPGYNALSKYTLCVISSKNIEHILSSELGFNCKVLAHFVNGIEENTMLYLSFQKKLKEKKFGFC